MKDVYSRLMGEVRLGMRNRRPEARGVCSVPFHPTQTWLSASRDTGLERIFPSEGEELKKAGLGL